MRRFDGGVLITPGMMKKPVTATVPAAPTLNSVTKPYDEALSANFTANSDGGSPIIEYRATATRVSNGAVSTATGTSSPVTVTFNMVPGEAYNCTVAARNAVGWSAESNVIQQTVSGLGPQILTETDRTFGAGSNWTAVAGTLSTGQLYCDQYDSTPTRYAILSGYSGVIETGATYFVRVNVGAFYTGPGIAVKVRGASATAANMSTGTGWKGAYSTAGVGDNIVVQGQGELPNGTDAALWNVEVYRYYS